MHEGGGTLVIFDHSEEGKRRRERAARGKKTGKARRRERSPTEGSVERDRKGGARVRDLSGRSGEERWPVLLLLHGTASKIVLEPFGCAATQLTLHLALSCWGTCAYWVAIVRYLSQARPRSEDGNPLFPIGLIAEAQPAWPLCKFVPR